ncbi:MAG: hypothetical protein ACTMKV_04155 [Sphingomonas parapaucimobilis]
MNRMNAFATLRTDTLDALIVALSKKQHRFDTAQSDERQIGYDFTPEFAVLAAEMAGLRTALGNQLALHLIELLDAVKWNGGDIHAYDARNMVEQLMGQPSSDKHISLLATLAWQVSGDAADRNRAQVLDKGLDADPFTQGADPHYQVAFRLCGLLGLPTPIFGQESA